MASDRDTLAELINPHQPKARGYWCTCGKALSEHIDQHRADVMLAAGWRPPAYVIDSPDELDTLPAESVVVDLAGHAWQADRRLGVGPEEHRWAMVFSTTMRSARHVLAHGSVTVVHVPAEGVGRE